MRRIISVLFLLFPLMVKGNTWYVATNGSDTGTATALLTATPTYNTDPTDYADADGFAQNNNKGSMILYNCTGHNNIVADYRITQTLAEVKVAELGGFG